MKAIQLMIVAATAAVMVLGGCKGGDAKKDDKAAAGKKEGGASAKSAHERIQGEFGIDIDAMIAADPKMAAQVKEKPEMLEMIKGMMGKAVMKITKDTMEMTGGPGGKTEKSTYTVKSQDGDKIVIESQDEGKDEKETITLVLSDGDKKLTGTKEGDKDTLVLVRK